MAARPSMPGVPAAGHVTDRGYWHPGSAAGCAKCPKPLKSPDLAGPQQWSCWRNPSHTGLVIHPAGWPSCARCQAAPAYHERFAYLSADFELDVYVPAEGAAWAGTRIAPRSAIVSLPATGAERVTVWYEGFVHDTTVADQGAAEQWRAGIVQAAGRAVTGYPTVATASLPLADLHHVGYFQPRSGSLVVTDRAQVDRWLDA